MIVFGLSHIDVPVQNLERAEQWWCQKLGFRVKARGEGWLDIDVNTCVLRISKVRRVEHPLTLRLQVENVESAVAELKQLGGRVQYEPHRTAEQEFLADRMPKSCSKRCSRVCRRCFAPWPAGESPKMPSTWPSPPASSSASRSSAPSSCRAPKSPAIATASRSSTKALMSASTPPTSRPKTDSDRQPNRSLQRLAMQDHTALPGEPVASQAVSLDCM